MNLRTTRVVHCEVEIARPASTVWKWILEDIAAGQHYARLGYRIDSLDDPHPYFKAYRLHFESVDLVDDIMAGITELDERAMRLSMFAEFASPQAKGLVAYVTYRAVPRESESVLQMDCHATFDLDVDEHALPEDIARRAEAGRSHYERDTKEWFAEVKARFEANF
jgi:hypothetical protein